MENFEIEKRPLLSFAIPTYNFGKFIAETVKSIEDGAEILTVSQFEIVILDGGSKDNTDRVVHELSEHYQNIRYIKQTERGGIDRDMNTVAELAKGEYIWLFSADDLLEPGWDKHIAPLLEKGGGVFLIPAILCDIRMAPLRPNPIFRNCAGQEPIEFYITPENDSRSSYLKRSATLEALFSYMSSVIVNASVWHSLPSRPEYFGSCWAHCARLMPLLFSRTKLTYLNHYLIRKRSGNDSFMSNGYVARIAIAVEGWDKIIMEFFSGSLDRKILYTALRKDMAAELFMYAKVSSKTSAEIKRLNEMAYVLYRKRSPTLTTIVIYFIYRLLPASAAINALISPLLPNIVRIRHKIKLLLAR